MKFFSTEFSFEAVINTNVSPCGLSPSNSLGNDQDYEEWLAHAGNARGDPRRNGCVLGVKETYRRLKKQSVCRNGRSFVVRKKQSPCLCTREDYLWWITFIYGPFGQIALQFLEKSALWKMECCTVPKLSVSTATMATTATKTPQSAWGKPGPPTKPWNSVWTERRTSFSQPGKHGHSHLPPPTHPKLPAEAHTRLFGRYRKVPSDRCEGGFSPQLAEQTVVRPCGVKPSPGHPASSPFPITHFDTPVSGCVVIQHLFSILFCFFLWV